MFELICMSLLGASYVAARIQEHKKEEETKEQERIRDLKIKVFCYAIGHHMSYEVVVKKLQDKELSFDDIQKYLDE